MADQAQRLQTELANSEVTRSGLEAQLRMASWPSEGVTATGHDEELSRQLTASQRDRSELRGRVEALSDKVRLETK